MPRAWKMADGRWQMADGRWQKAEGNRRHLTAVWKPGLKLLSQEQAEIQKSRRSTNENQRGLNPIEHIAKVLMIMRRKFKKKGSATRNIKTRYLNETNKIKSD